MKLFGLLLFPFLWTVALRLCQNFVQGTAAAAASSATGCVGEGAADVVFLLDSSYSIWRPDFRRQLAFVQEVIDQLPIGPNNIRVAIVTYADYPQLQFHLHHYSDKSDLRAAVEGIRQRGGFQTIMADAIRFIRRNVFEVGSRSRPLGVNVVQIAVVITDGRSDNRTATDIEAELTKQEGVLVFVVGVGQDIDLDELKGIGSLPSEYYTFLVDSFAGLARIRDLMATKTCKAAESFRSTKIFATSTTAARSAYTRADLNEASFSKAPIIKEMSTKPSNNKAYFTKAIFSGETFEDVTSSTKTASVKATLTKLVSAGVDSTSTTNIATSVPSRAPYIKSLFTRPTLARTGSSKIVSSADVSIATPISPAASTATYYTTSASITKLISQTSMLPQENVSLAPSNGIAGVEGSRKDEYLQPPTKGDGVTKLATTAIISGEEIQTVRNETVASEQPPNSFPTNTSEGAHEPEDTSSDSRASEDSTDNPHKINSDLEIICGLGETLNGESSSEASKNDGELEDEKDVANKQRRLTNVVSNGNGSGVEAQQNRNALSSCRIRKTTSTPVHLVQTKEGLNNTDATKIFGTIKITTVNRIHETDGSLSRKPQLMDGIQRRKVVLNNRNDNWGSEERRVLPSGKMKSYGDESDRDRSRVCSGRFEHKPGYQAKDFWRLDNRGLLVQCRMVSPGVYERVTTPSYRTPRLEPDPRRVAFQRSEATQSSGVDDRRDLDRNHFNLETTDEESRENFSDMVRSGHITARRKGRRGGFTRGSEMHGTIRYGPYAALERTNHELPRHHRPQLYTDGFWRLNDLGKLVWQNNTKNGNSATDNLNTKSPFIRAVKTLNTVSFKNNPDFPHTESFVEIDGISRHASNSRAHPRLNTAYSVTPGASFQDDIESLSKTMTREQLRSTKTLLPNRHEIDSHNPPKGFWKYDPKGKHGIWVRYTGNDDVITRNDDVLSSDGTTDAPEMTHASVNPTSGTKGPSLDDSDKLSYGYLKREKGKLVWYEYQSPGIYRKVIDTDSLAVPIDANPLEVTKKIRIELPPGRMPGCRGCNLTGSPVRYGHGRVNQSASSEETVVFRTSDRVEKLVLNRTRPIALDEKSERNFWQVIANLKQRFSEGLSDPSNSSQFNTSAKSRIEELSTLLDRIENKVSVEHHYNTSFLSSSDHGFSKFSFPSSPLDSVVRGMNGTGNSKRNWTYENMEGVWLRGSRQMDKERGHSQRTRITPEMQQGLVENSEMSSISTTLNPRRDRTMWNVKATRPVSGTFPTRRQLEPRNPNRVGFTASVHKKGRSAGKNPASTKSTRKRAKRCVAQRPLDVVFVVDPRARKGPFTRQLWQLAYQVVFQLQVDDDHVRVRFYPDLEEVKAAAAATDGSAESGNVQKLIQKVAHKPVPELMRMASRLLAKSRKGVRRIAIYLTDGPSGTPGELDRAAKELKADAAVELFAVGIGQETDPAELETIADSRLKGKHLYRVTKPQKPDIDAVAVKLARALCGGR